MHLSQFARRAVMLIAFGVLLMPTTARSDDLPIREIDLSIPPEKLPYELRGIMAFHPFGTAVTFTDRAADINGDGYSEQLQVYSNVTGHGLFSSAVIIYRDPLRSEPDQFNGRYSTAHIWSVSVMDVVDGPGDDLILTKNSADTILLEIMSWDSVYSMDTSYVIAAVGQEMLPLRGWNAVHVQPVASVDVNGDGLRDLIFSRSAKPDSAFPRGIVAYDIARRHQIWFYPTADWASPANFHVVRRPDGTFCLAFGTVSCQNSYAANGMDSFHAYLVSIDRDGRELWRDTIGNEGAYPQAAAMDVNGDGVDEICVTIDCRLTATCDTMTIRCYDAFTGVPLPDSARLPGCAFRGMHVSHDSIAASPVLWVGVSQEEDLGLYRLNSRLQVRGIASGSCEIAGAMDLTGDGAPEAILLSRDDKIAVLGQDLSLLAWAPRGGTPNLCRTRRGPMLLMDQNAKGFDLLALRRRSHAALFYARYKWHLAVVVAGVLLGLLTVGVVWIGRIYRTATGVPSLNRVNAMLLVLDQKGRIVLANENELVAALFAGKVAKRKRYDAVVLAARAQMVELIRESFLEPYAPRQGQFDIPAGDRSRRIELTVYPRVNKQNELLGKIVIAEDITGRARWQRKAVLAEATQQWIHRLKGNMATARIVIGNLIEDERLAKILADSPVLAGYIKSLQKQVDQTAEATGRILHFAGIGKPELVAHDINKVIDLVAGPYIDNAPRGVTVAKVQQDDLPLVRIDPDQMAEVIDNLMSNALTALGGSGQVSVTTRSADDLLDAGHGRAVEIVVEDAGSGVALEDLERIFLPGFTRCPGGTGIGLALVKEIVENHGGRILVESTLGRGSRFTVRIPVEVRPHE